MKTKLLPIVAILSVASLGAQAHDSVQNNGKGAYVTDSYGHIVRDSWGVCTRSINWTKESAIAACEKEAVAPTTKVVAKATPTPAAHNHIENNGKRGYAIDSDGNVVLDSWGQCVRTTEWTKENEIAKCEGKAEVAPVATVSIIKPAVVPVTKPAVIAPVVKTAAPVPTIASFRGFFDTNSATLKESAHHELDLYAEFMKTNSDQKIRITGHTDNRGETSYNQQLSERRAKAAKSYLVSKNISANRIATHGAGETSPISDNKTRDGRAHNRRVEVELVK